MYLLDCDKCWIFNLAPNEDAFDALSASTNACSDTSRHMCHVSATCRKYGVERTLLDAPSEVAGDFYLTIIMVILMIIISLHHGADDYNHMGMQWALQLGLHDGGY